MPGLEDAIVHAAGAVAGAALSQRWPWSRSPIFWCVVLWCATGLALQRFGGLARLRSATPRPVVWLPFYGRTSFETISHCIELVLTYFPLGFTVSIVSGRQRTYGSPWRPRSSRCSAAQETLQGWIVGRYGDVTSVAIAGLGAAIGVWIAEAGGLEICLPRKPAGCRLWPALSCRRLEKFSQRRQARLPRQLV